MNFEKSKSTIESTENFLNACGIEAKQAQLAISIRRALAALSKVDEEFIRANYTFDRDMPRFGFWDSLDTVAIKLELEREIGFELPDVILEQIPHPSMHLNLEVREFVRIATNVISTYIAGFSDYRKR